MEDFFEELSGDGTGFWATVKSCPLQLQGMEWGWYDSVVMWIAFLRDYFRNSGTFSDENRLFDSFVGDARLSMNHDVCSDQAESWNDITVG